MGIADRKQKPLKNVKRPGMVIRCVRDAVVLAMIVMCVAGCGSSAPADPYVIKIGDKEIRTGETTVQELADAGYDFSDLSGRERVYGDDFSSEWVYTQVYDLTSETEAKTVYPSITVVKDGQQAALITICNESKDNAPLSDCKITSVTVYEYCWEVEKVSVEEISFEDLSSDALTEIFGEPKKISDNKDKYTWERGLYTLELEYQDDGTVRSIGVNFNEFAS